MIESHQELALKEKHLLSRALGDRWQSVSGDDMAEFGLAWRSVVVHCAHLVLEISLQMTPLNLAGSVDDYPQLHVRQLTGPSTGRPSQLRTYFHGAGQSINQVWIARERITARRAIGENFQNVSDIAIAFGLDDTWLGFIRASHLSDVFFVRQAMSRDELALPDAGREWDISLLDEFDFSHEWQPILPSDATHSET